MVDLAFDHADVDFEVENLCGDGGAVGDVDVDLGFWVFVEVSCEIGDGEVVADGEADLASGKISVNSPIGKGLLGKSVGDVAEIQVPNGVMKFDIIEISR